jgi:hypothetical protein
MRTTMRARGWAAVAVLLAGLGAPPGYAQAAQPAPAETRPELRHLRDRVEQHFQVMVVRRGVILVPKVESTRVRTIEVTDGGVLVDGAAMTGRELRDRLGDRAESVIQLSFLDSEARASLFAPPAPPAPPVTPVVPAMPAPPAASPMPVPVPDENGWKEVVRYRHGGTRVRFGGDVTVKPDEAVVNDVVVILGSAHIEGRVDGDVVAVGGSVYLGAKADVRGGVTSVGGAVERASGSQVGGEINEVHVATPRFGPMIRLRPWHDWHWFSNPFGATSDLVATVIRIAVFGLFAAIVVAVAPGRVRRVADRALAEPWRAGLVGLAAQVLVVPLFVLTVVILAVSIIGIPLLLLVPFAVLGVFVAFLLGFAGTACAIGEHIGRRTSGVQSLIVSLVVGLSVVWALTVIARFAGLAGWPVQVLLGLVLFVGFLVEYVTWTVGLGAVLLSRFGRRAA